MVTPHQPPRRRHQRRATLALGLGLCTLLLLLQAPAAAGLFGFGKKKGDATDVKAQEAAARAGLEESMGAEAARKAGKGGGEPKKQKPRAGVTARKVC